MRRIAIVAGMVFVLGACGGGGSAGDGSSGGAEAGGTPGSSASPVGSRHAGAAAFAPLPEGPWSALARELVAARNLDSATTTTRQILARGGVGTWDGTRMLVAPRGPASSFRATPLETVRLAMEARHKRTAARMDAAEFAQMLEAFGWPFEDADPDGYADERRDDTVAREDQEALYQAATADREARGQARDAEREQAEALRKSVMAAPQAALDSARTAHREAAKAHRAAAASERPATMARMQAALAEVRVAQQAYNAAREQLRPAAEARRAGQEAAFEREQMEERVARQVGPDYAAGERFMAFLAAWVNEAAKHPQDPRSFTPLFLAEMARLQGAPVDLTGAHYISPTLGEDAQAHKRAVPRSTRLRLTLLEMELFVAAFHRNEAAAATASRPRVDGAGRVAGTLAGLLVPAAHAATPCSDIKESMGPDLGEIHALGVSETAGAVLGGVLEQAFGAGSQVIEQALGATAIVGKLIKLAAFYSEEQVTVAAKPTFVHKPLGGETKVTYTATAGVDPKELEEYERLSEKMAGADQAFRDCMGWAGFPTTTTIAEIAKDAENWLIDWKLVEGRGHVLWYLADNDFYIKGVRQATKLKRVSPSSAAADFVVRVQPESGHSGPRFRAYAIARAEVDAAGMPSLGTLVSAGKGLLGLADSLVEIASGWVMVMFKPKAYAEVEIEYHCPNPTTIHLYVRNAVADGAGDDGDPCTIVFRTKEEFDAWKGGQG